MRKDGIEPGQIMLNKNITTKPQYGPYDKYNQ
ncbi:hypothetical protein Mgra_00000912 [Meloidogyne graminicola]|uniref:Uncharacterized protein n=1 Tax=Meloidogyne graminicola TaxID=189291 RepID=A0A8T0A0N1_9BILA|nr:hypothetical protein Mgra_00000912 [Meloidogyne graminicola]KAF7639584.1 hypothetical protein Mgra_00000912 [Meloidogyne graminicola]